ncbi:hypothetical protein SEA_PUPPER_194 [Gordonia phage Pupper]|uniref:Uncharacterized protein n=1 Tax=Gordonia phage Pupper TaxID=2571249 RepID=A0A4Y6EIX2_9CAUD|nr:hypothetical protein KHQ83_gp083 [Gordonia phage Pupper]QDF18680.1 hypothetical protein SEA_PUPPER_194 [Gordonia phage Pupper]QDF18912.1 hypothetical protein SEA_SCENTAE_193 [Gordonia phage SCentae]
MIRCGNRVHQADIVDAQGHHHESVAQVRLCFARPFGLKSIEETAFDLADEEAWEAVVEAERRNEEWFENGGAASEVIWWENEQDRLREAGLIAY